METMKETVNFTISQLKKVILLSRDRNFDYKELLKKIVDDDLNIDNVIASISGHYCTDDEIISDDVFCHEDFYYSSNDYVFTDDTANAIHIDDAYFCQRTETYRENETVVVHLGIHTEQWNDDDAELNLHRFEGEYYDHDALDRNNLVVMYNGVVEYHGDVYYWESDGEYHYDSEEEDDEEEYVRDYHYSGYSDSNPSVYFTDNPTRFIGFEIEKEDIDVKESMFINDFEYACPKWKKERDGSLNGSTGFELISPKFELIPSEIKNHIESNATLLHHVNASKSNACGGHINVSEFGMSGEELFDSIKGYTPLFYALYYKRVDKNYCKGKKNDDLKGDNEKYQAIRIHSNRIEFRIVSAVPNLSTLVWRSRLIEYILNNKTDNIRDAFFNVNTSPLKDLLLEMYPNNFNELVDRLAEFSLKFENIDLNNNNN